MEGEIDFWREGEKCLIGGVCLGEYSRWGGWGGGVVRGGGMSKFSADGEGLIVGKALYTACEFQL